ncbi:hypothetical protein HX878_22250 [Pseudomonas veronii]|uniref:hypothetical protein n=1 Tax=Pseudomonas veronii TaxID=76761 RepID=UPI0015A2AB40|nr:hypothetical protein [Pseudomonas veronii]NWD57449.1 hypothetical protein [Pseudomonas veronii]
MQSTPTENESLIGTARTLSERLEKGLRRIEQSKPSKELLEGVNKLSLPYAIFLTEICEGACLLTPEQTREQLKHVEEHCNLVDTDFPAA